MNRLALACAALVCVVAASSAGHAADGGAPFDEAETSDGCQTLAPTAACSSVAEADPATGLLRADVSVTTALDGAGPSLQDGVLGGGYVGRRIENSEPVEALRIIATVVVDDAFVRLAAGPPGIGFGDAWVHLEMNVADDGERCGSSEAACRFVRDGLVVLIQSETGEKRLQGSTFTMTDLFYACGGLAPGWAHAGVRLWNHAALGIGSSGHAEANATMKVTSIVSEATTAPAGACV